MDPDRHISDTYFGDDLPLVEASPIQSLAGIHPIITIKEYYKNNRHCSGSPAPEGWEMWR